MKISPELAEELWNEVKAARDDFWEIRITAKARGKRLHQLLEEMRAQGLEPKLPTAADVRGILK